MKTACKRRLIVAAIIPALGLPIAGSVLAEGSSAPGTAKQTSEAKTAGRDMRASQLIGKEVRDTQGERLGEIQDLIVDVTGERVHYAVLAFKGELGLGDNKLFTYPISTFKPSATRDELVLNVDKEKLKNAPGFERNRWPELSDNRYLGAVERFFRGDAIRKAEPGERMVRASWLIGKNVDDRTGRNAGEIEDLVVNLGNERVRYVVLDFDKAWSPDDKLLPLPLSVLTIPPRRDSDLVLNLEREKLDIARGFDETRWPDLNAPDYRRDLDSYLSRLETTQKTARPRPGATGRETTSGASGESE